MRDGLVLKVMLVVGFSFFLVGVFWYFDHPSEDDLPEFKQNAVRQSIDSLPPPRELGVGFDPRVNTAVFRINDIDVDKRQLDLEFVYPNSWVGKKIVSAITCKDGEIDFTRKSEKELTKITWLEFSQIVEDTSRDYLMFHGRCVDLECREINRDCSLYIGE